MSRHNSVVKIYTRTGDTGETSLFDGTRVKKDDRRVDAYGEVDELNAWLGLVRSALHDTAIDDDLARIQRDLFALGAQLADPADRIAARVTKAAVTDADIERLERFLQTLQHWKSTRHAIELRHKTWFDDEVAECLTKHAVAVCMSDAPDWPMWHRVTTDVVYIRLHGHTRKYASSYSKPALRNWATRVRRWLNENRDVHVYFDNDAEGAAPKNALTLLEMLR